MRIGRCGRIVDGICSRQRPFIDSYATAEHVARCALMTAARIGAALKSVTELGSAIDERIAAGVRGVPVCRLYAHRSRRVTRVVSRAGRPGPDRAFDDRTEIYSTQSRNPSFDCTSRPPPLVRTRDLTHNILD